MKQFSRILMLLVAMFFLTGGAAMATPTLYDVFAGSSFQNSLMTSYSDSGSQAVTLTDVDGNQDDAIVYLMYEYAGFANENSFGIYGYTYDGGGATILNNKLELFSGTESPLSSMTLAFDVANGNVKKATDSSWINIGGISFGFYITTPQGHTYYSHTSLNNEDNFDHMLIFNTSDNTMGSILGSDVIIGIEDLFGGGDKDYNDMVVGVTDVTPVPEPTQMLLFGSALIGLAGIGRKKLLK
jgi:hypothetical protein